MVGEQRRRKKRRVKRSEILPRAVVAEYRRIDALEKIATDLATEIATSRAALVAVKTTLVLTPPSQDPTERKATDANDG